MDLASLLSYAQAGWRALKWVRHPILWYRVKIRSSASLMHVRKDVILNVRNRDGLTDLRLNKRVRNLESEKDLRFQKNQVLAFDGSLPDEECIEISDERGNTLDYDILRKRDGILMLRVYFHDPVDPFGGEYEYEIHISDIEDILPTEDPDAQFWVIENSTETAEVNVETTYDFDVDVRRCEAIDEDTESALRLDEKDTNNRGFRASMFNRNPGKFRVKWVAVPEA